MHVSLRPANPASDYPRIAALINMVDLEPITAETLHERDHTSAKERVQERIIAVDEQGTIVGVSSAGRDPWMKPGAFWLWIIADPVMRGQGIGTLLYERTKQFLLEQGAMTVESEVRDSCPQGLDFATRRGFTLHKHTFESILDLHKFDETSFAGTIEAAEANGIRFFTLADLGNTPAAQQKLYEINRRFANDNPGNDGDDTFAPFEEFGQYIFGASWFKADGQIFAAMGDEWVGMAAIGYFEQQNSAYNMFTGVDREYRGHHLGLALKLLAIRCARRYGAAYIRTNNDSENAPMLAINRKLGYQPEPGIYKMRREFEKTHSIAE